MLYFFVMDYKKLYIIHTIFNTASSDNCQMCVRKYKTLHASQKAKGLVSPLTVPEPIDNMEKHQVSSVPLGVWP